MKIRSIFFAGAIMLTFVTFACFRLIFLGMKLKSVMKSIGIGHFDDDNETKQINETITEILQLKTNTSIKQVGRTATSGRKKKLSKQLQNKTQDSHKVVLLYTPVFGQLPWPDLENAFLHPNGKACEVKNCRITYNKSELPRSDAVVFHGRDMPSVNTMKNISQSRSWKQRWVYFVQENPFNVYMNMRMYNGFFNWTMTYRRDSEFFVPYNYYSALTPAEKQAAKIEHNYAEGKDKLIAWMVSHCGRLRDQVTAKLLKYINVTVFGACQHEFGQSNRCDKGSAECDKLLKTFKFHLSFENANCVDYVTEKYWNNALDNDIVPIVLGPPKYDSKIAIPGSYINVMDFPSLEALASYLKYLDKNDTAYNEYFQWKLKYKVENPNPWKCQMCAALNNPDLPVKVYHDLGGYWDKKKSCGKYGDQVRALLLE